MCLAQPKRWTWRSCAAVSKRRTPPASPKPRARGLAPVAVEEVGDDAALALVDRRFKRSIPGIVLRGLAERVDRLLMVALRLKRVPQAAPRFGVPEFEVGPGAADLSRTAPVPSLQHARPLAAEKCKSRLPLRKQRCRVDIIGRAGYHCVRTLERLAYTFRDRADLANVALKTTRQQRRRARPQSHYGVLGGSDRIGHRLMPRDTVKPKHCRQSNHSGNGIQHSRRTVGHETILREIPVSLAMLRNFLVRDRDQYRR